METQKNKYNSVYLNSQQKRYIICEMGNWINGRWNDTLFGDTDGNLRRRHIQIQDNDFSCFILSLGEGNNPITIYCLLVILQRDLEYSLYIFFICYDKEIIYFISQIFIVYTCFLFFIQ